jgi:hypothetical protein
MNNERQFARTIRAPRTNSVSVEDKSTRSLLCPASDTPYLTQVYPHKALYQTSLQSASAVDIRSISIVSRRGMKKTAYSNQKQLF